MELFLETMPLMRNVPDQEQYQSFWKTEENIRLLCRNDAVICVSTVENKIMHEIALKRIERVLTRNPISCPHNSQIRMQAPYSSLRRFFNQFPPIRRGYNIFGKSLEETMLLESSYKKYPDVRINNQYKLHLPHFLVESVKCIEKFGLNLEDIFSNPGDPVSIMEIKRRISSGNAYSFNDPSEVHEVASLLKVYLRKLPGGIFPDIIEGLIIRTKRFGLHKRICVLNNLMKILPRVNREAVFLVLSLLHRISLTGGGDMNSDRMVAEFTPIFFHIRVDISPIMRNLIEYFPMIFTLQARDLFKIYRKLSQEEPDKLLNLLKRRVSQTLFEDSDIAESLVIVNDWANSPD